MMISVLLPTYNSAKYLTDSVQSILNQTYKNFELLIIDDGSTDNTEEIVKSFRDIRINYVLKEHSGLADSLNYGLRLAKYDWIARMDSDDIAHPDRLKEQIKFVNVKTEDIIIISWAAFFKNSTIRYTIETPISSEKLKEKLALHCYINHPTVLYNRKFILKNGGYNKRLKVYEDYELWLRIRKIATFIVIPRYLVFIKERKGSLSRGKKNKKNILEYLDIYYPLYKSDNNKEFSLVKVNTILGWREYFYGISKNARKYWLKNITILINIRVFLAFIITFLPVQYVERFKQGNFKLHLKFLINTFVGRNKKVEKEFIETLKGLK